MGLDITVYKQLSRVENPKLDEYGDPEKWNTEWKPGASMEWSEKHFPGRGEGIDPQKVYKWKEKFGFRAGSYSGYNWWRDKLNQFANKDNPSNDFIELINFADNEGVIGFVVSRKLAKDFEQNEVKAKDFAETLDDGEWWLEQYQNWKKAFETASDYGAVEFH